MRCHAVGAAGGTAGGGGRGRMRGPNLGTVGAAHTVDWLMTHVRNPRAHTPDSSMPAYEAKIPPQDLRALAEYLASLK
jgi:cbb3-type cytochrome oxidase cytochrome c subunit